MDLAGKRIIVTGCASGMGAATLRTYVTAGANVIGMDINDDAGRSVCVEAATAGPGDVAYLSVDIAEQESVGAAFEAAAQYLGGLDALAHPAAIAGLSDAADVSVADWDRMFAVNVRGTMLTNQAAYPLIAAAGGGAIINFGSVSGRRPEPDSAAYSASKGAVHAWTRTAAAAWGADGVRVNAVLPAIMTSMAEEYLASLSDDELAAVHSRNMAPIALGQSYGDPDQDLGPVMVFLASDASRFITGQLMAVDGGQTNVQ
ncbi:MAG: SDR family NAD(P)-dependent oxidoreductase [Ilumatobacter sp.]|nr:SDR family NAD(P)-dependent oxidoreductase [Ilumatobacter sp.]